MGFLAFGIDADLFADSAAHGGLVPSGHTDSRSVGLEVPLPVVGEPEKYVAGNVRDAVHIEPMKEDRS